MAVSAAGGDQDVQGWGREKVCGWEGRGGGGGWQEERLGDQGGGPILQGPNQRHSHTFTV